MLRDHFTAFDDWVFAATTVTTLFFSAEHHSERIANCDQIAVFLLIETISNGGAVNLWLEHAHDGKAYVEKTSLISGGMGSQTSAAFFGYDDGGEAMLRHGRFRLELTPDGDGLFRVLVVVAARDLDRLVSRDDAHSDEYQSAQEGL